MNRRRLCYYCFYRSPFDRPRANGEVLNQSFFKLLNLPRLKQAAGTLSETDLARINAWLP